MIKNKRSGKAVAAKIAKVVAAKVAGKVLHVVAGKADRDAALKARRIAEKAKPNMQFAEAVPDSDAAGAAPDATTPEVEQVSRKYGFTAPKPAKQGKTLHMIPMKPKKVTDSRVGEQKRVIIVDNEKVVGEQG
jgi:hypothetical protein